MIFETKGLLSIDYKAREWCILSYPGHPKDCPNYGKKQTCPPFAPYIETYFDLNKDHYFVVIQFNLGLHVQGMLSKHPNWSSKQARCVLYWQGSVKKRLKVECEYYLYSVFKKPEYIYNLCPEAMGVNVIETCQRLELPIIPKPTDTIFKVAMLGAPRSNHGSM